MSAQTPTGISWTDVTWNPGIFGCEKVSGACKACYAMKMARRLKAMGVAGYASVGGAPDVVTDDGEWTGVVRVNPAESVEASAAKALPKRKAARVFVTSMADLFHRDVPIGFIDAVFEAMARRPHLTFQVLTKRAERMAEYAAGMRQRGLMWPANVWAGVTVEDQRRADERIPHLLKVPARVRFLSMEPLLGAVKLTQVMDHGKHFVSVVDALRGIHGTLGGTWTDHGIDLVIVGGGSGEDDRPSHPDWFRSLRDDCEAAGVAFHFKQWGKWIPRHRDDGRPFDTMADHNNDRLIDQNGLPHCTHEAAGHGAIPMSRVGKHAAGRLLDGVLHDAMPKP